MRIRDLSDYLQLRRLTANPWEVVRFRNKQQRGDTLSVRLRDGGPLFLRGGVKDYHMFHRIFLVDEYRMRESGVAPLGCVVDLGANVGVFSVRASQLAERVIAYEPVPQNYEQARRNTSGCDNVTLVQAGVAAEESTIRLYHPKFKIRTGTFTTHLEMLEEPPDQFDEAPAITLDQLFERHDIEVCDMLKIDVEGQEYEVLHATTPDTLGRIRRIHGEYHDVAPEDPRTRIDHFANWLDEVGFETVVVPHTKKPNRGMFFSRRR
ncbi:MAG: FkbM family methyltransferase [Planctomycetota bacterium]